MDVKYDVILIGGGPAGLSAAVEAKKTGAERVLIIERDNSLGGILQQCIHPGFGLHLLGRELSGPEFAYHYISQLDGLGIEVRLNTMVLEIGDDNTIQTISEDDGIKEYSYGSLVLAMGCRERTRGAIAIPGSRPSGVLTAGAAQRFINIEGDMVGRKVVILGSGDIGMIMARRMTLEGAEVLAVVELLPYLSGLMRNKVQCLDDFDIPLYLKHTIVDIVGNKRLEKVVVAPVDDQNNPIMDESWEIDCDTLLLSVGLIPENELTRVAGIEINPITNGPVVNDMMESSRKDIYVCGNVLHVNDLADNVAVESAIAGKYAALNSMAKMTGKKLKDIEIEAGEGVRYTVPNTISVYEDNESVKIYFRVLSPGKDMVLKAESGGKVIAKLNKIKVSPGEIEELVINKNIIAKLDENIVVSCGKED